MFVLGKSYDAFDVSLDSANAVVSIHSLTKTTAKASKRILLAVLAYPIYVAFGFYFMSKRRKLLSNMKQLPKDFTTAEKYKKYKENLEELSRLLPALKEVSEKDLSNVPILLRFTANQMKKTTSTLVTLEAWLQARFTPLNTEQFKSSSGNFRFVSEKELWEKRTKVYKYWM